MIERGRRIGSCGCAAQMYEAAGQRGRGAASCAQAQHVLACRIFVVRQYFGFFEENRVAVGFAHCSRIRCQLRRSNTRRPPSRCAGHAAVHLPVHEWRIATEAAHFRRRQAPASIGIEYADVGGSTRTQRAGIDAEDAAPGPWVRRAIASLMLNGPSVDQAQRQAQQAVESGHAGFGGAEWRQFGIGLVGLVIGADRRRVRPAPRRR